MNPSLISCHWCNQQNVQRAALVLSDICQACLKKSEDERLTSEMDGEDYEGDLYDRYHEKCVEKELRIDVDPSDMLYDQFVEDKHSQEEAA